LSGAKLLLVKTRHVVSEVGALAWAWPDCVCSDSLGAFGADGVPAFGAGVHG
jgi:hypothetical protein